jgi:hypothetical protein
MTYDNGNPGPALEQAQNYDRVKHSNLGAFCQMSSELFFMSTAD